MAATNATATNNDMPPPGPDYLVRTFKEDNQVRIMAIQPQRCDATNYTTPTSLSAYAEERCVVEEPEFESPDGGPFLKTRYYSNDKCSGNPTRIFYVKCNENITFNHGSSFIGCDGDTVSIRSKYAVKEVRRTETTKVEKCTREDIGEYVYFEIIDGNHDGSDSNQDESGGNQDGSDSNQDESGGNQDGSDSHRDESGGNQDGSDSNQDKSDDNQDGSDSNQDESRGGNQDGSDSNQDESGGNQDGSDGNQNESDDNQDGNTPSHDETNDAGHLIPAAVMTVFAATVAALLI